MADRVGAVLMAYGTPHAREDVEAYYTDIRRGRPPTPELLADLQRRYDAIGGLSPLLERTEAQRAAIAAALEQRAPGTFDVTLGFKHVSPSIEDAVAAARVAGARSLVGLVLAPHDSALSVGEYVERFHAAAATDGCDTRAIRSWATEPALIEFLADQVRARPSDQVVFTAHSLPERVIAMGDPYPNEVHATAAAVAAAAALADGASSTAWQSAARTPEPWLRPDILTVIDEMDAGSSLLVCPCGFVSDHLEVLYDLDILAAQHAETRGITFARTASVNDDHAVMDALAARFVEALK